MFIQSKISLTSNCLSRDMEAHKYLMYNEKKSAIEPEYVTRSNFLTALSGSWQ